jgi:biopolymer transport protein ExbD
MEINRKVRSKKLGTRVDLTAMVSVSFLLIIFFMVTKELSKPNALPLGLPDNSKIVCGPIGCYKGDRIFTILLGDNNKLVTYLGFVEAPLQFPKSVEYGKDGIRKEIYYINKKVKEYSATIGKPERGAIVIIKPSNKCNYKNLVDILDEMKIAGIQTYSIINYFTPEEAKLLAAK